MTSWSVVYFERHQVKRAAESLNELDVLAYVPCGIRWVQPRNKTKLVKSEYPLFGPLVFVSYSNGSHSIITRITGFRRFIRINGKVAICHEGQVEAVKQAETAGMFDNTIDHEPELTLSVGDTIRVTGSYIYDGEGIIIGLHGEMVRIFSPKWPFPIKIHRCQAKLIVL